MALNSSDVNAGDNILAAHNNNLIDDIEQHIHGGTDTTKVKAENLDVSTGNVPTNGVGTASIEDNAVDVDKLAHNINATAIGFNADKIDGFDAGNASGNVPVSNGTVNTNLNADTVDGYEAEDIIMFAG